jgi:hypothetical protein
MPLTAARQQKQPYTPQWMEVSSIVALSPAIRKEARETLKVLLRRKQ